MEIERKFLISGFPQMEPIECARMRQGYLSTQPVVRIRSKETAQGTTYRLCIKGKGALVREEIEMPLEREVFERLEKLLVLPTVEKEYRTYLLPDGHLLECNQVDEGASTSFMYAEVEFHSVEQAMSFVPPSFLGREVTDEPDYSMGNYWKRKISGL